jgi:uncharacterized protein
VGDDKIVPHHNSSSLRMQLSNYVKTYPHDGKLVLFSTKRASAVVMSGDAYNSIKDGRLSPSNLKTLTRLGFLTADAGEEKTAMTRFLDEANAESTHLNAVVVLNLDCNLSCRYCYEGTLKGHVYMSQETADQLIRHITDSITDGRRSLNIDFYGGEPLLSLRLIKYISSRIKSAAKDRGVIFTFTLVTNGTLLTRKMAEELAPLGLKGMKITLDGMKSNHDSYRPYKSGKGSFDRIIRNIKDTCDVVRIGIGGNFERKNYTSFSLLLDYLTAKGITPESISSIKFDPITKTHNGQGSADFKDVGCDSINEPWLIEAGLILREEILKRGYKTPKIAPAICMMEIKNDFVVNCDGNFCKCPALVGTQDFKVGDLWTGIHDYRQSHNLDNWKNEECLDCAYLPLCFGGCRYMKHLRDGHMDGVDCKKGYLDATLEAFIKQDIKYGLRVDKC